MMEGGVRAHASACLCVCTCMRARMKSSRITFMPRRAILVFKLAPTNNGDERKFVAPKQPIYRFQQHPVFRSQIVLDAVCVCGGGGGA
jgi:hypothetical protein